MAREHGKSHLRRSAEPGDPDVMPGRHDVRDRHHGRPQRKIQFFLYPACSACKGVGRFLPVFSRDGKADAVTAEHEREVLVAKRIDHR